jgi:hypothetical protein
MQQYVWAEERVPCLELACGFFLATGCTHQVVEGVRLAFPARRFFGPLAQCRSQVPNEQGIKEKNEQRNPLIGILYRQGIDGRHQEKVKGEEGQHGGEGCCIAASRRGEWQDHQQIEDRDIRNTGIEVQEEHDTGHPHHAEDGQGTIEKVPSPGNDLCPRERRELSKGTHIVLS